MNLEIYIERFVIALFAALMLYGCGRTGNERHEDEDAIARHPLYAQGFDMMEHSDYVEILLYNPWNHNEIAARYYLIGEDSIYTPYDGLRVKIPVKEVAITSVTQIEFLNMIGELGTVKASCSPELIYNDELRGRYERKELKSLGDAFNMNAEQVMALSADVVFATLYNQTSVQQQVAEGTASKTVYDNEWTEATPLARAEWIKFIAAFYGKLDMADSIFAEIDSSYREACTLAASIPADERKSVMVGGNYRGTWYMPGGNSYMGTLLKDAGATYVFEKDTTTGSLALNFETVLHKFAKVEVWLNAPASTMGEIRAMDERHALFAPFSSGEVYGFYKRLTSSGANDFWESGVAHPDIILLDMIWALYPEVMEGYETGYMIRVSK